jgi:protein-tyrosine-phosphatase
VFNCFYRYVGYYRHIETELGAEKEMASERILNVLFLCTGNSARSIMAEALLNRLGVEKFKAFSAGSNPKGEINPYTLATLRKAGLSIDGLRSKGRDEFSTPEAPPLDFVFTLCDVAAGEECPHWPGQPMTAHWGLPDPAAVEGSEAVKHLAFADAFRMLGNRISIFTALPLESLDKLSLQRRLNDIGKIFPSEESA